MLNRVSLFVRAALVCATLGPVIGSACVDGNTAERTIDRNYAGITAFPVARHLGLDDSCNGRRLLKIKMWASSSAGSGMATLIVNGRPQGVTQTLDDEVRLYEFPLDLDYNVIGTHVGTSDMEIRLSGDFYIQKVEARLGSLHDDDDDDVWDNYGILLGKTENMGEDVVKTTIEIDQDANPLNKLVFIARKNPVSLHRVTVYFGDGTIKNYGPAEILKNEAARIDNEDCKVITKLVIKAHHAKDCDCGNAVLEVRGVQPEDQGDHDDDSDSDQDHQFQTL